MEDRCRGPRGAWIARAPIVLASIALALSGRAAAAGEDGAPPAARPGVAWAAVPGVSLDPDAGAGLAVLATRYLGDGATRPFKHGLLLFAQVTTRLQQTYEVRWEGVDLGGRGLRLLASTGVLSSGTGAFCGTGNEVPCDPAVAEAAADARGLAPGTEERGTFLRRFYRLPFVRGHAYAVLRRRIRERPFRLEWAAAWRGAYYFSGTIGDRGPYEGSHYAGRYPGGEEGRVSTLEAGLVLDARDAEIVPTRGVYAEVTARGTSPAIGASWAYAGLGASLRAYAPLAPRRDRDRLVAANRLILDGVVGDPPIVELPYVGGTFPWMPAFGGELLGRGIRIARYLGEIKVVDQLELRARLARLRVRRQRFTAYGVGFADLGWIGAGWDDLAGDAGSPTTVQASAGGALRLLWGDAFLLRLEVGFAPSEDWAPFVYLGAGPPP